jgi:hypothetical protein
MATPTNSTPAPGRRQFSLRGALLFFVGLSVLLAVVSQFPRHSTFLASMAMLLIVPLSVTAILRAPLVYFRLIAEGRPTLLAPVQLLALSRPAAAPTVGAGLATALLATLVLAGLWPLLREIGSTLSILSWQTMPQYTFTWNDAWRSLSDALLSRRYWLRLWQWELWSLGRWWLLFAALTVAWLALSLPLRRRLQLEPATATLARLLSFGPWIIVLEVTFLIGVWVSEPNVIPEPSTGFVVGIFGWELWHWDCWCNREWLIRGALPSLVVGCLFFCWVLRWRWPAAVAAAVLLIPVALTLSVACTVAWQNGLPPIRGSF